MSKYLDKMILILSHKWQHLDWHVKKTCDYNFNYYRSNYHKKDYPSCLTLKIKVISFSKGLVLTLPKM